MTDRATVIRARKLRRIMTPPEVRLWQYLRTSPEGLKFRRQHPVGRFVLDFYCPSARTAIEVDGLVHDMGDNPERDEMRDAWLAEQEITVMRIAARDVMADLDAAARLIVARCATPLHHPPSAGGPPPRAARREDAI
jgi:very-short-patch-repair endonuclease